MKKFSTRVFTALSLLLVLPQILSAEKIINLPCGDIPVRITGDKLEVLRDREKKHDITSVRSPEVQANFHPVKGDVPNFGYSRSAWWFRFSLQGENDCQKERYLLIRYSLLDHVSLYFPAPEGSYTEKITGQMVPFEKRDIRHRNFIFKLPPAKKDTVTFYLKVYTEDSLTLPLEIMTADALAESMSSEQLALGILYGFLAIMVLYNLFLFLSIKEKNYLYLVIYIVSFLLFIAAENGVAFQYLWPSLPWWGKHATPFSVGMVIIWSSFLVRSFLGTKELSPVLDFSIKVFLYGEVICCLFALVIPYFFSIIFAVAAIVFYAPLIIFTGFKSYRAGHRQARYFLIAWSALAAGSLLYGLKAFGLLPDNFMTRYGVLLGACAQVLLLSMGLADQLNRMTSKLGLLHKESEKRGASLLDMVDRANSIARELLSISSEQSGIANSFTLMAQDQAALSEEMGATYEELAAANENIDNSMIEQVREGEKTGEMSHRLQEVQEEVTQTSMSVLGTIEKIISSTGDTGENLEELSEMMNIIDAGGKNITSIISMIEEITDQINLLSLNAAIEAARAGEHGRGFAVVADEIGKLAQLTSDNSKGISTQVTKILADIARGLSIMQNASSATERVNSLVADINTAVESVSNALNRQEKSIDHVIRQVESIQNFSKTIATSTSEQRRAMEETAETIQRLTSMAQNISENGEVLLTITTVLNKKADELRGSIDLSDDSNN